MRTIHWGNWGITFLLDGIEVGRYHFPVTVMGPVEGTFGSDLRRKHNEIAMDWEIDGVMLDRGAEEGLPS